MTPNINIIDLAEKHGQTSYRNRADTKHPAYGFTEEGLQAFAHALLAAAPQAVQPAVPVLFVNHEQLESHTDHLASEAGRYLPARKTAVGKFTMPLYAHPSEGVPAPAIFADEDHVLVPRGLIGAACSAIDKKRDGTKTLAELRRYTTGDLSTATQPAAQGLDERSQFEAEYERLFAWRARWMLLASKSEHGRLQSRQERIERKAVVSNNKIRALMKSYDKRAAQAKQGGA